MQIILDTFEGPLDLLLHLVDKAEVDIYEISVSEITDQYVAYIHQMQTLELEIASEFLVMAASLIALKSRMLLPAKEEQSLPLSLEMDEFEEIDSRDDLIQRLIEYRQYKELAGWLREKETERSQIFTRPAENLAVYIEQEEVNPVANVSLFHLMDALQRALEKPKAESLKKISRDEVSIGQKIKDIRQLLRESNKIAFHQLFDQFSSKEELVVSFLAILEMMKKNEVVCLQEQAFSAIWIIKRVGEEQHGA